MKTEKEAASIAKKGLIKKWRKMKKVKVNRWNKKLV